MKKLDKKAIDKIAAEIFKSNKTIDKILITEDGQVFDNDNLARSHNREVKGEIFSYTRVGYVDNNTGDDEMRTKALGIIEKMIDKEPSVIKGALTKAGIPKELSAELLNKTTTHENE